MLHSFFFHFRRPILHSFDLLQSKNTNNRKILIFNLALNTIDKFEDLRTSGHSELRLKKVLQTFICICISFSVLQCNIACQNLIHEK